MSRSIRFAKAAACGLLAAGLLAGTAQAAPKGTPVTASKLAVWSTSGNGKTYLGQLRFGQRFQVDHISSNLLWAYGKAGGKVDRSGWVRTVALKGLRPGRPTPLRIRAKSEDVIGEAAGLPVLGTLHKGDAFSVIRFSGDGREAYGVAGGNVDQRGWIDTSALGQF